MDDTRNYTSERRMPPPRDLPGMYDDLEPLPPPDPYDPTALEFMNF